MLNNYTWNFKIKLTEIKKKRHNNTYFKKGK